MPGHIASFNKRLRTMITATSFNHPGAPTWKPLTLSHYQLTRCIRESKPISRSLCAIQAGDLLPCQLPFHQNKGHAAWHSGGSTSAKLGGSRNLKREGEGLEMEALGISATCV